MTLLPFRVTPPMWAVHRAVLTPRIVIRPLRGISANRYWAINRALGCWHAQELTIRALLRRDALLKAWTGICRLLGYTCFAIPAGEGWTILRLAHLGSLARG
jgi:hypothetical protein